MTVKEAILLAADEIGAGERVRAYFENNAETGKKETEMLLPCFNIVENDCSSIICPSMRRRRSLRKRAPCVMPS